MWNGASGKVETNPKCVGLDMHNQLLNVSYDLHGINPTEATLRNQESAATTVNEAVTVVFSNYGAVGNVISERTVVVTLLDTQRKYTWTLTKSSVGINWVPGS